MLFAQNTLKQAQVVQIDIFKQQSATIKPNIFKTWSSVSFTNELIKLLDKIEATDINSERYWKSTNSWSLLVLMRAPSTKKANWC